MRKVLFLCGFVAACACTSELMAEGASDVRAAKALLGRVLKDRADAFDLEIIPADKGKDVFEIESKGDRIVLRGNTGVSIASGLNWYLKHYCHCQISWCGTQMKLPEKWPVVPKKVRQVSPHQYRTFFNYCTAGYEMPWWTWKEWESAIDLMAMNGYNMPLAMTGMEGIWYNTLLRFDFTDLEARSFLSGPGHLPFVLMQCLEGFQGPLPKSWIDSHIALGRRIIERERELGMTPIQQGFSGHVPRLLKKKFPEASIAITKGWCGFPGIAQLDPLDPLFKKFGTAFIEEEVKLFGTDHLYGADPFHESAPPRPGAEYLTAVGKQIIGVLTEVDPKAIWIMQGWTNHRQIIEAVPKDRLLILSIGGAKNGAYYGYNFLNCRFNNYGGRTTLHGNLGPLAANPFAKVVSAENSNCKGTGLMMESMNQNPVWHQMTYDLMWRSEKVDPTAWLRAYARRRYGAPSEKANQAWGSIAWAAYRRSRIPTEYSSLVAARPALHVKKSGPNDGWGGGYDPRRLFSAWELLLADANTLGASDAYRFDVMDIGRQVLSDHAMGVANQIRMAFAAKDAALFKKKVIEFETLLADLDTLLATRSEYHFGKWVADARAWGKTPEEKLYYEKNASTLVTIWGPTDKPIIFDYAWREWAGLVGDFYLPRWKMFHAHLADCLTKDIAYVDPPSQVYGRESFRANEFYKKLADWELAWCAKAKGLPAKPTGDTIDVAKKLLAKYRDAAGPL